MSAELINIYADIDGVRRIAAWTDGSLTWGRIGTVFGSCALDCGLTPAQQAIELAHILALSEDLKSEYRAIIRHYKAALRAVTCGDTEHDRLCWVFNRLAGRNYRSLNGRKSAYGWTA
jgi:hypothetical protein